MKKLLSLLLVGLFTGISFASASDYIAVGYVGTNEYDGLTDLAKTCFVENNGEVENLCSSVSLEQGKEYTITNMGCIFANSLQVESYCNSIDTLTIYYPNTDDTVCYEDYEGGVCNLPLNLSAIHSSLSASSAGGYYHILKVEEKSSSDTPILGGVSDSFANGITSGVSSLLGGFGDVIPQLILFALPLLVVFIFWKKVYGYLKRIFTRK